MITCPFALVLLGCGDAASDETTAAGSDAGSDSAATTTAGPATSSGTSGGQTSADASATGSSSSGQPTTDDSTTDVVKFDVGVETGGETEDTGPIEPSCKVSDNMDAVVPCVDKAPPDSYEPDVQWIWEGDAGLGQLFNIPLVANLTDDNDDGEIDLCDIPDIVVTPFANYGQWDGRLYILDGATGAIHTSNPDVAVDATITPALGDIDGDGLPEIIALGYQTKRVLAFEHDGALKWESAMPWTTAYFGALALADLEGDGDVEILGGEFVWDHEGQLVIQFADAGNISGFGGAVTAADLDDDGDLEVVLGRSAYHHDGAEYYNNPGLQVSYPQVADLDDDPQPEILLQSPQGISMLEHDGAIKFQDLRPTGAPPSTSNWYRPSTVHDFDGDGVSEFAVSAYDRYAVYEADASIKWTAEVLDASGVAGSTAFDFLGDGVAEAMYADETHLYTFDDLGGVLLQVPRSSGTIIEYPVVVDVDNDGSAEVLVISNAGFNQVGPALQVIRDVEDRWVPARRIWNQHTYHVTNVREDGTIPAHESKSWEDLNTFRTQAQVGVGGICKPEPPG